MNNKIVFFVNLTIDKLSVLCLFWILFAYLTVCLTDNEFLYLIMKTSIYLYYNKMHKQTIKSLLQKQIILLVFSTSKSACFVFCACSSFLMSVMHLFVWFLKTNIYLFYNKIHKWTTAIKSLLQKQIANFAFVSSSAKSDHFIFVHIIVFNVDNKFSNWL